MRASSLARLFAIVKTNARVFPTVSVLAARSRMQRRQAAVEGALAELSDRDREILLLWDAGLTYQDIAAQTGLSIGAIGTTLNRARKKLVEVYESKEGMKNVARG